MNKTQLPTVLALFFLFCTFSSQAQFESLENIEEIKKEGFFKTNFGNLFRGFTDFGTPFSLGGGIGLNLRSYSTNDDILRQDPFVYDLSANTNVRIYKINLPFSLMVTAKQRESSLPDIGELVETFKQDVRNGIQTQRDKFVRWGISPNYKWIKLHAGHRSMNFSKFTLADLNFYGVGAELTPGNFRFSAMRGRLAKAEPIDLSLLQPNFPVYERMGWGAKVGYGTRDNSIDFIAFKGSDDQQSIIIPQDSEIQLSPEENLTLGVNVSTLLFNRLRFRGEYGLSTYSPNSLDAMAPTQGFQSFLIDQRNSTEENTALDARLDFEANAFVVGVQVRRIEPNYQSMGAYFFNNDVVDYLGNLSFDLFNGSMAVTLNGGVQANNLDLLKEATTTRVTYGGAINYSKKAFSTNLNYSNNTTDVGYVLSQELDSLNVVIITEDAGVNMSYAVPDANNNQHVFVIGGNVQQVSDDVDDPLATNASKMYVAHFVYNYALSQSKWKFSLKANYNQNELSMFLAKRYGGGLGIHKSLFEEKMTFGLDVNYFINQSDFLSGASTLNGQFTWGYRILDNLRSNLNTSLLQTRADGTQGINELMVTFGMQYYFNFNPFAKKQEIPAQ